MNKVKLIFIVALVILGAFFVSEYMAVGTTTLSLDKVDFRSTDPILDGKVWVINFVQGGLAQSYFGQIPAGQADETGKYVTEKKFSMDITNTQQFCRYPMEIDENRMRIFEIGWEKLPMISTESSRYTDCLAYAGGNDDNIINIYRPPGAFLVPYLCVYKAPLSSHPATFNTKSVEFVTDFEMNVGGTQYKETLNTIDVDGVMRKTAKFGNVGYITWVGNLVTGDECPSPAGRYLSVYDGSQWHIISQSRYDTYKIFYESTFSIWNDELYRKIVTQTDYHNSLANLAMQDSTFKSGQKIEGTDTKGTVTIDITGRPIQFPTFAAYISANEVYGLGVYQPIATPKILSAGPLSFKTGETGYVNVLIKNIGSERGGFSTSVTCDNYITMIGTPIQNVLQAGDELTVTVPMTGSSTSSQDTTCTARTEVLGKSDTYRFNAHIDIQKICTEGHEVCIGEVAKICKNNQYVLDTENPDRCKNGGIIELPTEGIYGQIVEAFEEFFKTLFGEDFSFEGLFYTIIMIVIVLVILYLAALILPILLPLLAKALIGLIFRK